MDPNILERLSVLTPETAPAKALHLLNHSLLPSADWSPVAAGKAFGPAEAITQWVAALATVVKQREVG